MGGQKGTLARMKRSGGGAGDTVEIRDGILLSSEIWRANADILGRVRCPPALQVLQGANSRTGLRIPPSVRVR